MKLKQLSVFLVILSLLAGIVTGCQPQFQPGSYTDDMGRVISLKETPQRIVSHVPSITETLFALGLEERVAGVCDYCDYPEEAKLKASVGNYFNPSIENIVALEPDLVLTDGHSESIKQLDSLGITYLVLNPKDIEGLFKDIELLGKVTGGEAKATKLVAEMKQGISRVRNRVKDAPLIRVFYVIDATDPNNPWTAGPGSFIDTLITMAGGENSAGKATGAWVQFSIEQVVSADPEIIILPAKHGKAFTAPETLQEHPAWRGTTAVRQNKIYTIDGDLVDRTGPRLVQGLQELAKIIHPELFR